MVLLGVVANLLFALPAVVAPDAVIRLIGGGAVAEPVWPAFAAWLLILLSLFYLPAAYDPFHYRAIAMLTVLARFAGVVFFTLLHPQFALFALMDLFFGVTQGALLLLLRRAEKTA
ncbi:hypothetical protein SAMN05192555_102257 [Franzmannia pantelleriensis]|uniref:Uncharacterized protein n=1 Tax=Franzmannia pantelleriensis TaxID=48727 RepID=A0A1G9GUJ0_9GAMM|nr:hypothetical protein [Halomonas pantelleriensis]SDL04318.1 hypothetical protein SAMN05192555_102257 [Halomonas pantelleriensis]